MAGTGSDDDEEVITVEEFLEAERNISETANRVLGNADDEKCSYINGYVKRQPLYSCLTCAKDLSTGRAGFCLACAIHCHDDHELVELYTKRNFRCDCGNTKFGDTFKCLLNPDKEPLNELNNYNHNFDGLYCTCNRPYPDPDNSDTTINPDDPMSQCSVCEDWFHAQHIAIDSDEDIDDLACAACVAKLPFLHHYAISSAENESPSNNVCTTEEHANGCKLASHKNATDLTQKSLCFPAGWRTQLCRCSECMSMYHNLQCSFLLDEEDSLRFYEAESLRKKSEKDTAACSSSGGASGHMTKADKAFMKAISNMDRVRQIEMIRAYKNMSSELSRFLHAFPAEKVIKTSDIQDFFEDLRSKHNKRMRFDDDDSPGGFDI